MRRSWFALTLLVLVMIGGGVSAGDKEEARDEALAIARLAMEAKLKIGDLYRQRGEFDAAHRSYTEALEIYQQALRQLRARPSAPDVIIEFEESAPEEETVIEVPIVGTDPASLAGAVDRGLKWLVGHQDEDGRWDCDEFAKHDPAKDKSDGPGGSLYDVGVTGLALTAILRQGYTDAGNPYADTVRRGLKFLIQNQDKEGCFGSRASQHFMYNHVLASLAMCEAWGMTKNPDYKPHAQRAVNFILMARNPYMAWRYEPRGGENDTSVTGWCVRVLGSAKAAGLQVDPDAYEGARAWIDKATEPNFGQVGYNYPGGTPARPEGLQDKFPPEKSQAMTASGVLTRMIVGENPKTSAMIQKGVGLMLAAPPVWNERTGQIDMYYWLHGTLALRRVGGQAWQKWRGYLAQVIATHQHPAGGGSNSGSWDPVGPWGPDGGRVYSTALMTLCLQACLPRQVRR